MYISYFGTKKVLIISDLPLRYLLFNIYYFCYKLYLSKWIVKIRKVLTYLRIFKINVLFLYIEIFSLKYITFSLRSFS